MFVINILSRIGSGLDRYKECFWEFGFFFYVWGMFKIKVINNIGFFFKFWKV